VEQREKEIESNLSFIFYITCFIYRKTIFASRSGSALQNLKLSCRENSEKNLIKSLVESMQARRTKLKLTCKFSFSTPHWSLIVDNLRRAVELLSQHLRRT
jgi:hypothetical protein